MTKDLPAIIIDRLDHFVITVHDINAACEFYNKVLGMQRIEFADGRTALSFGRQKINLHPAKNTYYPKAEKPVPGSGDFCLITKTSLESVITHLKNCGVSIIEGPIGKSGAIGPIKSVYFRDPDGNLIEMSNYM
ncbi:MAG: VOC family virulence protein [Rhodospirillaceae bacterium TMED8]|nr:VOC family virulence protein [Magnetovibrio sp.]OUT51554.1 MAG: VOC family virulence protein [Rhodospirillaceae bacterium TMED8]|tara:strand:- start:281 stop:682 length:402 start_codon:yes stop_codon:yes gene_type:complete